MVRSLVFFTKVLGDSLETRCSPGVNTLRGGLSETKLHRALVKYIYLKVRIFRRTVNAKQRFLAVKPFYEKLLKRVSEVFSL